MNAFRPATAATVNISTSTSSARVQIAGAASFGSYRVHNAGTTTAFIAEGDVTVTAATTTGVPIPAGAIEVLSFGNTHIAAILASGTGTLYITPGDGI